MAKRGSKAKSKKSAKHGSKKDLISELPDEILAHILSFVPTDCAVATSVLSKRWNRVWISVPNLDFFWHLHLYPGKIAQFVDFVDRVLNLNKVLRVRNINLICCESFEISRVNAWIRAIGERDAEGIDLILPYCYQISSFPDSFFTQKNLVNLKLTNVVLKLPEFVCFPSLKNIHLESVEIHDDDSMKNLMFGCPVLSSLKITIDDWYDVQTLYICSSTLQILRLRMTEDYDLGFVKTIVIDAPNLIDLTYSGRVTVDATYDIINVSSLMKADLCLDEHKEIFLKLLPKISHVRELELFIFMNGCDIHRFLYNLPMFHNLIHLTVDFDSDYPWKILPPLLNCMPNLVTFIIGMCLDNDKPCAWFDLDEVPQCFSSCLESIEISNFGECESKELRFISYILKNAMVLKKLSIQPFSRGLVKGNKFLRALLTLPKSSVACVVEYGREVISVSSDSDDDDFSSSEDD